MGPAAAASQPKASTYRLVVRFVDNDQGVDEAARKAFDAFLDRYRSHHRVRLPVTIHDWGKKGERDYCLTLEELDPATQAHVVRRLHRFFGDTTRVELHERASCRPAR